MTDLTVQVVNYDTAEYLRACLGSVLATLAETPVASRVVVLDNGSSDDLTGLQAEFAEVAFVASPENLGFGGGHNLLARGSRSPFLAFVNPDVVCERRDALARLLDALADPAVAAAGPLLRTTEGEVQPFDHGELRGLRARVANGAGHAHWRPRRERADAAWVAGAFLVVRRAAFDAVGGFDEDFFLYKEEEDLCLRIRRAGGRVVYVPDAEVRHIGSVVAGRDPELLAASDALFAAKHVGAFGRRVLRPLYRHVTRRL